MLRPSRTSREPFKVRPVELVMLEQRWLALWNAVETGELPVEEWRTLAAALSVADPGGRRWRVASGSHPGDLRFVVVDNVGEYRVDGDDWPWPETRRAPASVPASGAGRRTPELPSAASSPPARLLPRLPVQVTYAPGRTGARAGTPHRPGPMPPARPRRAPSTPLQIAALAASLRRKAPLDLGGWVRGAAALVVAVLLLLWSFSRPEGAEGTAPEGFADAPTPGRLPSVPVLLPSPAGALTPAPLDWRDVTCFSGDGWLPTQRSVGEQMPCAGLHRVATAVLPMVDSPTDPFGACVAAADRLGAQGSRRAAAGQWVDVDGGLLVCTVAPADPAATDPVIP